jgi:spore germination protein YaaH
MAAAKAADKTNFACVANFGDTDFDGTLAHGAFVDNKATLIANLVKLAATPNLDGINIDFEGLLVADRDAYSSFLADLGKALHAAGAKLVVSIPAKTADDPSNDWSWPYDYADIGGAVDLAQVMTYDEHVPGQAAGPVAGLDWMSASLTFALSKIPAAKILSGLPAYGYVWNTATLAGYGVDWKDFAGFTAANGAGQWDAASKTQKVAFTDNSGNAMQALIETPAGIQDKARLAKSLGLAGTSAWALCLEDTSFWNAVGQGIH